MDAVTERSRRRPLSREVVAPLPPALLPARAPIDGRTVRLEPVDARVHTDELFAAATADDAIWDYLGYGPWTDRAAFAAHLRGQAASFDPVFYAIRDLATGQASGVASLMSIVPLNGSIEIGHIWLGKPLQKTTAATEALYRLMDYALTGLGYRRLEWKCNALNAGSRAAAVRFGFYFEGLFYHHMIIKGRNRDTAWFSILDDEWRDELRPKYEAWLAEENFDAAGNQRTSLRELIWRDR